MPHFHGSTYDLTVYKVDPADLSQTDSIVPDYSAGIGGDDFCNLIDWKVDQATGVGYFLTELAYSSVQNPPEILRLDLSTFAAGLSSTVVSDITSDGYGNRLCLDSANGRLFAYGFFYDYGAGYDKVVVSHFDTSDMSLVATCTLDNAYPGETQYWKADVCETDGTYLYISTNGYTAAGWQIVRIRISDMTEQGVIGLATEGFKDTSSGYISPGYLYCGARKTSDNKPVVIKVDLSTFTYSDYVYVTSLANEYAVGLCGDGTDLYVSTSGAGGTAGSLNKISLSGFTAGSPVSLSAGNPLGVYLSLSQAGDLLGVTTSTDGSKRVTKFRFDKSDLSTLDSEMTTYTHSFYVSAPLIDYAGVVAAARRYAVQNAITRRR